MLYNRASADPAGRPWSEQKRYIWWDAARGQWVGPDVPDFPRTKPPDFEPDWSADPRGLDAQEPPRVGGQDAPASSSCRHQA